MHPSSNNSPCAPTAGGFTLVELLVAISILGLVAVLGWRGLDSIVRARIALTSDLEQTRGMQLAFAQLQNDCAHLADALVLPHRTPLSVGKQQFTLVRTVYADNQPTRLKVISYRVNNGVLTRSESAATRDLRELDSLWLNAVNDIDTNQGVILQSDVTAMDIRLWIAGDSNWRTDFSVLTPAVGATVSQPVPAGLEVSIKLNGRDTGMLKIFLLGAV